MIQEPTCRSPGKSLSRTSYEFLKVSQSSLENLTPTPLASVWQKILFFPWKQPWAASFYLRDSFERLSFFSRLIKLKATVSSWKYFPSKNSILAFPENVLLYYKGLAPDLLQLHNAWYFFESKMGEEDSQNLPVFPLSQLTHFH